MEMKTYSCNAIFVLITTLVCIVKCDDNNPDDSTFPCGSSVDLACVRTYFDKNGRCESISHANELPVYEDYVPFFIPKINLTVIVIEMYVSNMEGKIEQFYKDKESGNLVISINFKALTFSGSAFFVKSRKEKEPKVVLENFTAIYPVVLTAVIPATDVITIDSLQNAYFSAYYPDNNALLSVGPKFTNNKDPDISAAFEGLVTKISTVFQEMFLTQIASCFLVYVQNHICDFGLESESVLKRYDPIVAAYLNEMVDIDNESYKLKQCAIDYHIINCVRSFFEDHGICSTVDRSPEGPMYRERIKIYVPSQNLSAMMKDVYITGLDGKINSFYINKESRNLVMAIHFPYLTVRSALTDFYFSKRGRQPLILTDQVEIDYDVILTAVIPMNKGIITSESLMTSMISSYFLKDNVRFKFGPSLGGSKDPTVLAMIKNLDTDPMTPAQETLINEASNLFVTYLQEYICDFGLEPHDFQL